MCVPELYALWLYWCSFMCKKLKLYLVTPSFTPSFEGQRDDFLNELETGIYVYFLLGLMLLDL